MFVEKNNYIYMCDKLHKNVIYGVYIYVVMLLLIIPHNVFLFLLYSYSLVITKIIQKIESMKAKKTITGSEK